MKVYLSGRMSGLPAEIWRARFYGAYFGLMHRGIKAVNPADTLIARHPWLYKIVGYRLTLWYDLQLLRHCDLFTMVGDDWQQSRGARLERMKAREWGIPEMTHVEKKYTWNPSPHTAVARRLLEMDVKLGLPPIL